MKNVKFLIFLIIAIFIAGIIISCETSNQKLVVNIHQFQIPILLNKVNNPVLQMELLPTEKMEIKEVTISLEGSSEISDIRSVKLFSSSSKEIDYTRQFGFKQIPSSKIIFKDKLIIDDITYLHVSIQLNDRVNLHSTIKISCNQIKTDLGNFKNELTFSPKKMRLGVAVRQHMDDNVHTYRIPGLTTTNDGTLLAIYDVRRESSRDLQGNIDIGLSRSTNGGNSWEPMQIVLDKGEWENLPEKFNGVSDACILVDENSKNIFVAGLWMHGVLDENGQWIEGLTADSEVWEHQWRRKGSQPGFDPKRTSQFLITKSTDDGLTWSEPENLTRMCKKEQWWLWAPAPGKGITLNDGTLVMPTQGRDENGKSFSNITWSKDGGKSWTTSNPAYENTSENMAAQLSDGSIMLNMRHIENRNNTSNNNGRAISVTNDLGETWTEHPTSRNALIEPTCMASIHKHVYTENGEKKSFLLFSNPNSKIARDHMTIKVSFDDGRTWPEENWLLLDELRGRGYSCITSIDENTIGILYEGSQADMTFQSIPISEVIQTK